MKHATYRDRGYLGLQDTPGDKVFMACVGALLIAITVTILVPLLFVVSASFSSPSAVNQGRVMLWPVEFTLEGYAAVMRSKLILTGFANSLLYMVTGTALNVAMTMLCAFPLSRKEFYGRSFISLIFLFTMYFSGGLIPSYILISRLGLIDTRLAMILPGAMSVWFVIVARTFMQANIPDELFEAARMDGCTETRFFASVLLPLCGPIIAVLTLYYAVGHWNSYFGAFIYLRSEDKYPLQLVLRSILVMNQVDKSMITDLYEAKQKQGLSDLLKYAVIVVSSVPVMLIYPFVQKYFVKGVMVGALKG